MFCMMRCMGRRRPGLPSRFRWRCAILGYQVGTVISGGLTPVIAVSLLALGGNRPWLICGYITVLCALSLWASVVACRSEERRVGKEGRWRVGRARGRRR